MVEIDEDTLHSLRDKARRYDDAHNVMDYMNVPRKRGVILSIAGRLELLREKGVRWDE